MRNFDILQLQLIIKYWAELCNCDQINGCLRQLGKRKARDLCPRPGTRNSYIMANMTWSFLKIHLTNIQSRGDILV